MVQKYHRRCLAGIVGVIFAVWQLDKQWMPHSLVLALMLFSGLWMVYWADRRNRQRRIEFKTCTHCGGSGEVLCHDEYEQYAANFPPGKPVPSREEYEEFVKPFPNKSY